MTGYALELSEEEVGRYLAMAAAAEVAEASLWDAAGIVAGARLADVGCGPGAALVAMARRVAPEGSVVGVDQDPAAVATARRMLEREGLPGEAVEGDAGATGLEPASFDVVTMRHVLAHNGPREQELVDHAASLARPGGNVYLVDIDASMMRLRAPDAGFQEVSDDLMARYSRFHEGRGNDLRTGLRLDLLLETAGMELVAYEGRMTVMPAPPGMRPPAWAARAAMLEAGVVDESVLRRWEAAFDAIDRSPRRPLLVMPTFVALGRRTAA